MTGAANRRRGARAEVQVVNYLRSMGWINARRYLSGDGRQPGDIDFAAGVCLEVKDRAGSAWPTWRAQCVAEANGRIPVVVRRTRGVTDVGQWEAQMLEDDWWDFHLERCNDRACSLGNHLIEPIDCSRTGLDWVRTTFCDVAYLLAVHK